MLVGRVQEIRLKGETMYKLVIKDESGTATATWFNQSYIKNIFRMGEKYKFYGKISNHLGKITINSPVYESCEKSSNTGKIIPIYPLTFKLTQNTIISAYPKTIKYKNFTKKRCNIYQHMLFYYRNKLTLI